MQYDNFCFRTQCVSPFFAISNIYAILIEIYIFFLTKPAQACMMNIVSKKYATVAQLVEHLLAKEEVAGSSPVCRSKEKRYPCGYLFCVI